MKNILNLKEKKILADIGSTARSLRVLYNSSTGRDKALMRAGMWMAAVEKLPTVAENGIRNSVGAATYMRPFFSDIAGQEEIWALLLDNQNRPLDMVQVNSTSTPAGASLNLRGLLQAALATNASALILAHNHPSCETNPSSEDRRLTESLRKILSDIGVECIDHLIITAKDHARII